jgi:hypothetical protein
MAILLMMIPMVFTVLRQPQLDAPGKGPARVQPVSSPCPARVQPVPS